MTDWPTRFAWERVVRRSGLGLRDTAVALAAATYANQDGTSVRPGVSGLATGLDVSERTVERSLSSLVSAGYLTQVGRPNHWRGRATEFRLALPDDASAGTGRLDGDDETTRLPGRDDPTLQADDPTLETRRPDSGVGPQVQDQLKEPDQDQNPDPLDPWVLAASLSPAPEETPPPAPIRSSERDDGDDWEAEALRVVAERDALAAADGKYQRRYRNT